MLLGIIGAMKVEIDKLVSLMNEKKVVTISGMDFYVGKLCDVEIILVECGAGKVNAAICAQTIYLQFHPTHIINIGVAGSVGKNITKLGVVIAKSVVQYDVDKSLLGDPIGMVSKINKVFIDCDSFLNKNLLRASNENNSIDTIEGIIATGDKFLNSSADFKFIEDKFNAKAVEMEGGSIGQVCFVNNIPFSVIKTISDSGEENSPLEYNEFVQIAANNSIDILLTFLEIAKG